jgi:PAS domain S-box-containing protein
MMTYRAGRSLCVLAVILLGLGWCVGAWRAGRVDAEMRQRLQQRAVHIAQSLNPEMVKALSFRAADKSSPAFQFLCKQMTALGRYIPQRGIYSMTLRDGRLVFGPENYPQDDPMSSPPGLIYEEPAREAFEAFTQGKALTAGPYADEYGTFVSAFAPVFDPGSGAVLMVVAIDTLADDWETILHAAGREPLWGSLILLGVLLAGAGVTVWYKRRRTPDGVSLGRLSPGDPDGGERVSPAGRYASVGPLVGMGVLAVAFLVVVLLQTWYWTYDRIDQTASQQARLAVEFDKALRDYVGKYIRPEMEKRVPHGEFIPEAMSTSFVARNVFDDVRKLFPDTVLRFASTNPRNPVNRATPAEESLIRYFEQHPEADVWSGTMQFFEEGEKYLVCATPRRFETSCLQCHGRPEEAPASLVARYGPVAGFGRSLGEVSVDLAAIPVSASYAAARAQVSRHMLIALGLCLVFLGGIAFLIGADARRRRQAGDALRASEAQWRRILDNFQDAYFQADVSGRLTLVSPSAVSLFGYDSIGEMIGMPVAALYADAQDRTMVLEEVRRAGRASDRIGRGRRRDGTAFWVSINVQFVRDERGQVVGTEGVARDITERKQAEEMLGESEKRLREVIDSTPFPVALVDAEDDRIHMWSRSAIGLFGHTASTAQEWYLIAYPDPEYRQDVVSRWKPLLETARCSGQTVNAGEYQITCKDGSVRICELYARFISSYLLVTFNDVTERRRAEEALRESDERLRRTLDAAQTVAWEGDLRSGAIIETGPVAALFGQPEDAVCTNQFAFLERIHPEDRQRVLATAQSDAAGQGAYEVEFRVPWPNGEIRWIQATGGFDREADGRPIRLRGVARDITAQKRAERQQTMLLQQLDGINQELKDFAYIVSHDLKAPLRAIRNLADWLCTDYQDKLDAEGQENLRLLRSRVDRMQNLIDGVLQYSRIGRTEQKTVPIDLNRLVPEIIDDLGVPEHITVHIDSDLPTVEADATRITQVFQNLLSNAVKYMNKPQGNISVGCVPDDGFWKFSVADNGPGIERKDYERIFKLFQTLTCRDDSESTGVGLTVTKKIVEVYGGRIWVESEVGKGSTFFFTFPRSAEAAVPECLAAGVGMGHRDVMEVES